MRSLVTGCAGFIGSHLTESLLGDGDSVVGIDCFNNNYGRQQKLRNLERAMQWDDFEFVPIDLARGDLFDLVDDCDRIFHLAAEPGVRPSWGNRFEQYLRNNVLATQHLLEAARVTPSKRFVYASSSSIYGQAEAFPTPETATPQPFSPYGVTKLSGEHLCELYHGNFGVNSTALRLFSVYGPRQRPDMAFHIFLHAVLANEPIVVFGDGTQTRDFTYVEDVVAAFRLAADASHGAGQSFNIGGGSRVSLKDTLPLISALTDREPQIEYREARDGDVRDTCADTTRAREQLGFDPTTELSDGLAAELEWAHELLAAGSAGRPIA